MTKYLAGAVSALMMTAAFAATEVKAETRFAGSTTGCFGTSCTPVGFSSTGLFQLSFTGSSFDATTSNNQLNIGGITSNFGTFALSAASTSYNTPFTLRIVFTMPAGTNPSPTETVATVTGSVSNLTDGGVYIDFDNTPRSFTFGTGGAFQLVLNDISVSPNRTQDVNGRLLVTAVPGPVAGTGLAVLLAAAGFAFARRRFSSKSI